MDFLHSYLELKLSGQLVRTLVLVLQQVAKEATVYYSENGISMVALHPKEMVTVMLRINSTGFDSFRCEESGVGRINLHELSSTISLSYSEESIIIHADEYKIGFCFVDGISRVQTHMELIELKDEHVDIGRKLRYEYRVVLGIPSTEFRRIFEGLKNANEMSSVFVTVTNREVEFAAIDTKFVLARERGEYISLLVGERDQDFFVIDLSYYLEFMALSFGSDKVFILHSSDAPPMLNFPIANAMDGNIMFYLNSCKNM